MTEHLNDQIRKLVESTGLSFDPDADAILVLNDGLEAIACNDTFRVFFGLSEGSIKSRWGKVKAIFRETVVFREDLDAFCDRFATKPHENHVSRWEMARPFRRTLDVISRKVITGANVAMPEADVLLVFRDATVATCMDPSPGEAPIFEAVGRVTAGIAHDFNNLLTGIHGNIAVLEMKLLRDRSAEIDEAIEGALQSAKLSATRAAKIVKQLLGYSSRSLLNREPTRLNTLLLELCSTLRQTVESHVRISVDLESELKPCLVDAKELSQVILNMCINAHEAVSATGEVNLVTRNLILKDFGRACSLGLTMGEYVVVSVKDNGRGMAPEVQDRLFEPFFSTKSDVQGTGLGLATSQGIVRQHGGAIDVTTVEGEGSVFNIYLPVIAPVAPVQLEQVAIEEEESSEEEAAEIPIDETSPRRRCILVVDDEAVVRSVAEQTLKHANYKVITACHGKEALEIVRDRGHEIDLILSDLTMPELSGLDAFKRLRESHCPIPFIICSGFFFDMEQFVQATGGRPAKFIQKPFELTTLIESVREVLAEKQSG